MEKEKIIQFTKNLINKLIIPDYPFLKLYDVRVNDDNKDYMVFFDIMFISERDVTTEETIDIRAKLNDIFRMASLDYALRTETPKNVYIPNNINLHFKKKGSNKFTDWMGKELNP